MKKILLSFIFLFVFNIWANQVTLFGKVYDEATLQAIPNATVSVHGRKVKSNKDGYYFINRLDYGIIILEANAKDYLPFTTTMTLDDKRVRYDIPLKPTIPKSKITPPSLPKIPRPVIPKPVVPKPTIPKPATSKALQNIKPNNKDIKNEKTSDIESLDIPERIEKAQQITTATSDDNFFKAKKLIENGDFLGSLPYWYAVTLTGNSEEKMKAFYYLSIIYKTQSNYYLELDYLYKTLGLAIINNEKTAFINQLKVEIANVYKYFGKTVFANTLIEQVLKQSAYNFPLTNFNAYEFLANKFMEKRDLKKAKFYLEKAMALNVKPEIKQKAVLRLIDIYIADENFDDASKLLNKIKARFQSSETEKREYLLLALKENQDYLQKGNISGIINSVIPELQKALEIDPQYHIARAYLINIEFLAGKLSNKLEYVIDAKKQAERLKAEAPYFKDQSGKKPEELLNEIKSYLKNM